MAASLGLFTERIKKVYVYTNAAVENIIQKITLIVLLK
jgi:hypothetical protein